MFKRTFWTAVGYSAGIGSSIYVQRRVRRTVQRYTPEHVRIQASTTTRRAVFGAKQVGRTVSDAYREGRHAMTQSNAELQREFPQAQSPGTHPQRTAPRGRIIRT
ncbi:MAG: hypothetical protein IH940_12870 [Acidobacteria bacterium]|nr:hypothetical protein [Acidobacteriota bacterium]